MRELRKNVAEVIEDQRQHKWDLDDYNKQAGGGCVHMGRWCAAEHAHSKHEGGVLLLASIWSQVLGT